MKEAKPTLQILNSNTPTNQQKKNRGANATAAVDDQFQSRNETEFRSQSSDDHQLQQQENTSSKAIAEDEAMSSTVNGGSKAEESGRERLKRHRVEVAGGVWIPDIWGQEDFLNDWIDCAAFDSSMEAKRIMSARAAMVEQGRRAHSSRVFSVENSC